LEKSSTGDPPDQRGEKRPTEKGKKKGEPEKTAWGRLLQTFPETPHHEK